MEENNETIAGFEVFSNPEDLAASTRFSSPEQPVVETSSCIRNSNYGEETPIAGNS